MWTVLLLIASNVFMTIAWYGHLRFKSTALWKVILISWAIALAEYCLQVPANRIGHGRFSAYQLKIIQEVITLSVFIVFALVYLHETVRWNYLVSFVLICGAVYFAFLPSGKASQDEAAVESQRVLSADMRVTARLSVAALAPRNPYSPRPQPSSFVAPVGRTESTAAHDALGRERHPRPHAAEGAPGKGA